VFSLIVVITQLKYVSGADIDDISDFVVKAVYGEIKPQSIGSVSLIATGVGLYATAYTPFSGPARFAVGAVSFIATTCFFKLLDGIGHAIGSAG
jgi:hypothetical protein